MAAARVLVIAPHYDDEVLGCAGLLTRLAERGVEIHVLFLSDGSGGVEGADDPVAYGRRRRRESAEALQLLGASAAGHLDLEDGCLERHRDEMAAGIQRALAEIEPDLLLAPSPLENSPDHRAAFHAVHDALTATGEHGSDSTALEILLYEVNQPGYADVLVDVSGELDTLRRAMSRYASQQERHDYLRAALGLRHFRTLTLPPEVQAAEGYRRLRQLDFTSRTASQLIAHLGGVPDLLRLERGPEISIVVRTRNRPELLQEALASLAANRYSPLEVVLVNDGGTPPEIDPATFPFTLSRIDLEVNRGRAAAAQAGVEAATGDYLGFLDDDDLLAPEHLSTLAHAVAAAGVRVAYTDAAVCIYSATGGGPGWQPVERRLAPSRDFDRAVLLLDNYIPFHTLLIERRLFAEVGPFDESLPIFEDWDYLIRLSAKTSFLHVPRVTCEYRHFDGSGSQALAGADSSSAEFHAAKARVLSKHADRLDAELLSAAIIRLRREFVDATEAARRAGQERDEERRRGLAAQEQYHRLNGELAALKEDRSRLLEDHRRIDRELRALHREARLLRDTLAEREASLAEARAQLDRLSSLAARRGPEGPAGPGDAESEDDDEPDSHRLQ